MRSYYLWIKFRIKKSQKKKTLRVAGYTTFCSYYYICNWEIHTNISILSESVLLWSLQWTDRSSCMELVQRMNLSYSWRTLLVYPLLPAKKNKKDRREYIFLLIGLLHSPVEYSGICSHLYDVMNGQGMHYFPVILTSCCMLLDSHSVQIFLFLALARSSYLQKRNTIGWNLMAAITITLCAL